MARKLEIAAISGSLRKGSFNTKALRAVEALSGDRLALDIITLEDVEPFNEDVEKEGWPPGAKAMRERIAAADGVLIATPEYNYSIPGVLKNAIDWASRPPGKGPILRKPAGVIGASMGTGGTARAQAHLRQVLYYCAAPLLGPPEILIARAHEKFDENGALKDEETRKFLSGFAARFADWVEAHRAE